MNVINLIGRLTRDVDLKRNGDKSYGRFSIAVNRRFKKDEADFFNCVAFGKTSEIIAEYIRKGQQIGITGHMQMNQYEKDGQKRTSWDVIVDSFDFINSKGSNNESRHQGEEIHQQTTDDEDFPF